MKKVSIFASAFFVCLWLSAGNVQGQTMSDPCQDCAKKFVGFGYVAECCYWNVDDPTSCYYWQGEGYNIEDKNLESCFTRLEGGHEYCYGSDCPSYDDGIGDPEHETDGNCGV